MITSLRVIVPSGRECRGNVKYLSPGSLPSREQQGCRTNYLGIWRQERRLQERRDSISLVGLNQCREPFAAGRTPEIPASGSQGMFYWGVETPLLTDVDSSENTHRLSHSVHYSCILYIHSFISQTLTLNLMLSQLCMYWRFGDNPSFWP